jgi:hypothetical protein
LRRGPLASCLLAVLGLELSHLFGGRDPCGAVFHRHLVVGWGRGTAGVRVGWFVLSVACHRDHRIFQILDRGILVLSPAKVASLGLVRGLSLLGIGLESVLSLVTDPLSRRHVGLSLIAGLTTSFV